MVSKIKHPYAQKGLVNVYKNEFDKWDFNNPECAGLYFGDSLNKIITKTYPPDYGYPEIYITNFLKTYCNDF
jgi:hypothetical protein